MKKIAIVFCVDNIIDIITNSSSELFVLNADNLETVEEMVSTIYPNYLDEYQKIKSINDLDEYELDIFINTKFRLWNEKNYVDNYLPGFKFADIYEDVTGYNGKIFKRVKTNFISDNIEALKNIMDPKRNLFFMFSEDENPNWDMQELLMDIGERYHLG